MREVHRAQDPHHRPVVPWQFADLPALGLTAEECAAAVQWVAPDRRTAAGPDAIAKLLQDSRWSGGCSAGRSPGRPVRALAWPVYRWVARNRHRMPGGTAACALPARGRPENGTAA